VVVEVEVVEVEVASCFLEVESKTCEIIRIRCNLRSIKPE